MHDSVYPMAEKRSPNTFLPQKRTYHHHWWGSFCYLIDQVWAPAYAPSALYAFKGPWLGTYLMSILLFVGSLSLFSIFIMMAIFWKHLLQGVSENRIKYFIVCQFFFSFFLSFFLSFRSDEIPPFFFLLTLFWNWISFLY